MKTLAIFSMLFAAAIAEGIDIDCLPPGNAQGCFSKLKQKIPTLNLAFLPKSGWSPSVIVTVHYRPDTIRFRHCCRNYTFFQESYYINPLYWSVFKPVKQRSAPEVKIQGQGTPSLKYYTIIMVDPDVPKPHVATKEKPLLHWLVINRMATNDRGSKTILPYKGPAPPDQKPHRYIFMVYEQTKSLDAAPVQRRLSSSRYHFDVKAFADAFNLTLKGVNWYYAQNDPYTNFTKVHRGEPESKYCSHVRGWTKYGCITVAGADQMVPLGISLLLLPVVLLMKVIE